MYLHKFFYVTLGACFFTISSEAQTSSLTGYTTNSNTVFGVNALSANPSGSSESYNTAIGYNAMNATNSTSLSGGWNVAVGAGAMQNNTKGFQATALGVSALWSNTTGEQNVAVGSEALAGNFDGSYNTAVGTRALWSTVNAATGTYGFGHASNNTALGFETLQSITTGSENIGVGVHALSATNTGQYNIGIGNNAIASNTTAQGNTAIGYNALQLSTTASNNVAIGNNALQNYTSGIYGGGNGDNVAVGLNAMQYNKTGSYNVAIGEGAYQTATDGLNNVVIGYQSDVASAKNGCVALGLKAYSGNHNAIAIGQYAKGTGNGSIAIGNLSIASDPNSIVLGNIGIVSAKSAVSMATYADSRAQKNVAKDVVGLKFINMLTPITFNYDADILDNMESSAVESWTKTAKESVKYSGFSAQSVDSAATAASYDFSGVDKPQSTSGIYGLKYGEFVVPMVKAIQELSAKQTTYDSLVNVLQNKIAVLDSLLATKITSSTLHSSATSTKLSSIQLAQNYPNPFTNTTSIEYSIEGNYSSAYLHILNTNGVAIKQVPLNTSGSGLVSVDASNLSSGVYFYTLYVDGQKADSKKMIIQH